MKQPDSVDVGTQMDVVRHRLNVAREDLETAHLTFEAKQYRGANNRAYYSIFHTICAVLAKEGVAFKRHKDEYSNAIGFFRNCPSFASNGFISVIKYWYQLKAVNDNE